MSISSRKTFTLIVITSVLMSACTTLPEQSSSSLEEIDNELKDHVLRINHDGLVVPPKNISNELTSHIAESPVSESEFYLQFNRLLNKAECFAWNKENNTSATKNCFANNKKTQVKLLIHVHGGLIFFVDTYKRVSEIAPIIEQDGDDWHYPIFISWPSSPFGTYGEHLTSIRSGKKVDTLTGALTSPFVLLTDLMQIGNIVSSVYRQSQRVITEIAYNTGQEGDTEPEAWRPAKDNYDAVVPNPQCTGTNHSIDGYPKVYWSKYLYPKKWSAAYFEDYVGRHTAKSLTYPIRSTIGTIYNSAIVESAWRNMKRRTKNIFYPPETFIAGDTMDYVEGGRFFKLLLKRINGNKQFYDYEITLVAHSMGTMVLNHAFKKYRSSWIESDALKNIVYMAAAASLQNTMDSVFPIISQINDKPGQTVTFYNLTLNRLAEISETTAQSLLPNGSLLINIDDHLETPETPLDRTMGQETNVLAVIPVIKGQLGNSVTHAQFKSFDRYQHYGPDKHGSFNKMPFWRKSFWSVDTQTKKPWSGETPGCLFNGYPKNWLDLEYPKHKNKHH